MSRSGIDALGLARRLRERAGFSQETAEETASAIADSLAGELVTRSDLRIELAELKADLTRLILTVATGQVALLIGTLLAFARPSG